jgi:hypothetical protein
MVLSQRPDDGPSSRKGCLLGCLAIVLTWAVIIGAMLAWAELVYRLGWMGAR